MAYIFGQHLYSERRYSWIDEWSTQVCQPDVWFKSGCLPGAWDVRVCEPGVWQPVIGGPVPPLDPPAPPLIAIQGRIRGEIRPIGSLHAKVYPPDAIAGHITGSIKPVGSLHGTITLPAVRGTITGVLRPVGSIHASLASDWVGILPQFGPIHLPAFTVSTVSNPNDTETINPTVTGTGLSLDRIPGGKVVWKIFVPTASIDARIGLIQEITTVEGNLQWPPGFAYQGICYKRDGKVYDGFLRPVGGPTWGSGSYLLMGYKSSTGEVWVGTTDFDGSNPVWFGDPLGGTGAISTLFFSLFPHVAIYGVGSDVFRFMRPVASEIPGRPPLGIHGVVHPVGSLHGTFTVPPVSGTITGTIQPVGSLHGLVTVPTIAGTITGVVRPVGSLHGTVTVPTITGTITGVVRPVGSLHGAVTGPAVAPVVTLTASGLVNGGGTFNNAAIGAATSDRLVVVCVGTVRTIATPGPVTAVTINGSAATKIASANSSTSNPTAGIFAALVTTGTTCNIVCTVPGGADNVSAQVYTVKGLTTSGSAYHTATSGANDGSVALNIPSNGVAIGVATGFGSLGAYTWTGLTKDYDAQLAFNNFQRSSTASQTGMSAQTGRTISISGGGANDALVTASWL